MTHRGGVGVCLTLAISLGMAKTAKAVEYAVYLDLDRNAATGCTVTTADGPFAGIEQALVTTVANDQVTSVDRRVCVDAQNGAFGPPIPVTTFATPWPVGLGLGTAGSDVIETCFPLAAAGTQVQQLRLGFGSNDGYNGQDALLSSDGSGGSELVLTAADLLGVPALTWPGLGALALLLGALAALGLRRRAAPAALLAFVGVAGGLLAAGALAGGDITLDGNPGDWAGVADLTAFDIVHDAPQDTDILAGFATLDPTRTILYLRIDATQVHCPPPDQCHELSLFDPATGICSNPPRPNGSACTIPNSCSSGSDVCQAGLCVPADPGVCANPVRSALAGMDLLAPASAIRTRIGGAKRPSPTTPETAARPRVMDPEARRAAAITARTRIEAEQRAGRNPAAMKIVTVRATSAEDEAQFDAFVGYWLLETIDDWNQATAIQFYRDPSTSEHRARFYEGTQNRLREVNANDLYFASNPVSPLGPDVAVESIGPKALRFFNTSPAGAQLSSDELTSTFRIQDSDPSLAYAQYWTAWDGTGDDARYGALENLTRYRKLAQAPAIQRNDQASPTDWSNPVEIFHYVYDYYAHLGQVEKLESLHQTDWIGAAGYQQLYNDFLTTGKVRTAYTSTEYRGGGYIGVWRTKFPGEFPLTTIHTAGFHHFTPASTVTISGFTGAYAVLNGVRRVAAYPPSTISESTPAPWQAADSREHFVYIEYDSSGIAEAYDPNIHGVGKLEATHGPITPTTGYRDMMAAIIDFMVSSFGPGTHTRLIMWMNGWEVPATFADLHTAIAADQAWLLTVRLRTYQANGNPDLYWNPLVEGGSLTVPEHNLNDPFGIGLAAYHGDAQFDRDIDVENYLDPATTRSVFFTVTGPTVPTEPITSLLTAWGYPSNGSQVVFTAGAFGVRPPALIDGYGTHNWVPYASANDDPGGNLYEYHHNLAGGIVRSELSCGHTVAYVRVGDEDAFDAPLYQLSTRSLAFGRSDMASKVRSNWTAALAALLSDLNTHHPDRYVLDIRDNGGGFSYVGDAFGALFGGNRPGQDAVDLLVSHGLDPTATRIPGSGIKTGFDSAAVNEQVGALIDTDEAAAVFPAAIVRGNAGHHVDVVILTSTHAASAGDTFPHSFLGGDQGAREQDLGYYVRSRIVGDIDGRLWSGLKGWDSTGIDPLTPAFVNPSAQPRTALYMTSDAGMLIEDRNGTEVNAQTWTQPAVLLPAWYDATSWQDLGLTQPVLPYPLGVCTKPLPTFSDNSTWRDIWLEFAIVD
jgi:hypothetical protein